MPDILVDGKYELSGDVYIQGSKNSVLPILAASVLTYGVSVIENCPALSDVRASINILKYLGAECSFEGNSLTIDSRNISDYKIPDNLMREMRSSSLFLGAILGRMGKAEISSPGGCELGPRPIDLHIKALSELGATVKHKGGNILLQSKNGLVGSEIHLAFPSVGATENILLASVLADGITVVTNAAKEPEIEDLADFLISAGANIEGAGSDKIVIKGVRKLFGTRHKVIPDRIVAATYISCVAATGGNINLINAVPNHIRSVISAFEEAGCEFKERDNILSVKSNDRINSISTVRTLTYPAFPTDAGPQLISALSLSKGTTVFVENIFQNRFRYIDELKRFGANIKVEGKVAVVEGVESLSGTECECTDLRGGAALVVAALAANGTSKIRKTEHILRGYENIVRDLSGLGARIKYI